MRDGTIFPVVGVASTPAEKRVRLQTPAKGGELPSSPTLEYIPGFGNTVVSEALPGALPAGQNNPQRCPYGLYAEQLSGTAFTVPRDRNMRSWLYRIRPSVQHSQNVPCSDAFAPRLQNDFTDDATSVTTPNQLRWMPLDVPDVATRSCHFVQGLHSTGGTGEPTGGEGLAIHNYVANCSMDDCAFTNADGDFLIVPQQGALTVRTEFGVMHVAPKEICVLQRGMRLSALMGQAVRILELGTSTSSFPTSVRLAQRSGQPAGLHPVAATRIARILSTRC